jgi:hypothetical protein
MAANKALPLIAVGAAAIILLPKKKKKATRGTGKKPEDKTPRIQFDDECGWLIPDDWWEKAGGPRFKKIVDDGLAGAADWPAKFELLKTPAFNSHKMSWDILAAEVPTACPLPPVDVDIMAVSPTSTKQEDNMLGLFAHMIEHVESTMMKFVQTQGEIFEFPVPIDG